MSIEKLSTITDTPLGKAITEARALICNVGDTISFDFQHTTNVDTAIEFLRLHPQNQSGEFYKYYFDTAQAPTYDPHKQDASYNPAGNNLLLLAVAQGCFNRSNRDDTEKLVLSMVADAQAKLPSQLFQQFINFKYCYSPLYYFDNTPLTLAIKAGMIDVATQLAHDGADVNVTSYGPVESGHAMDMGKLSPLHLVLERLPIPTNTHTKELALLRYIAQDRHANTELQDFHGRTAKDMANIHNLRLEDAKYFAFRQEADLKKCYATATKDETGRYPAYSLSNLSKNAQFTALFHEKHPGQEVTFSTLNSDKIILLHRHTPDFTKIFELDIRQLKYDAVNFSYEFLGQNYDDLLASSDISPTYERTYPHSTFHGTPDHLEICGILGVAPCQCHGEPSH